MDLEFDPSYNDQTSSVYINTNEAVSLDLSASFQVDSDSTENATAYIYVNVSNRFKSSAEGISQISTQQE